MARSGPARVVYHASPAEYEARRASAIARLAREGENVPAPTGAHAFDLVRERMASVRLRRSVDMTGLPPVVASSWRTRTARQLDVCVPLDDDARACPTDKHGRMVEPDLPLPKYRKA